MQIKRRTFDSAPGRAIDLVNIYVEQKETLRWGKLVCSKSERRVLCQHQVRSTVKLRVP